MGETGLLVVKMVEIRRCFRKAIEIRLDEAAPTTTTKRQQVYEHTRACSSCCAALFVLAYWLKALVSARRAQLGLLPAVLLAKILT